MKLCRFETNRLGVVAGGVVHDVTAALAALPAMRWPLPLGDALIAHLPELRAGIAALLPASEPIALERVRLDSPVANPSKLIGAPVNYRAHVEELDDALRQGHQIKPIGEWGLFLKANSALCGPAAGIAQRFPEARTDHEVELAVIIGQGGTNIPAAAALSHVAGYAVGLDITLRGPQFQSFRKSMDSYAVLGPWLVTADELPDPGDLEISLLLNGMERQRSRTSRMMMKIPDLIAFASSFYTLYPGDVIFTGSPEGVGPIQPGDVLRAEIEQIGAMEVQIRAG